MLWYSVAIHALWALLLIFGDPSTTGITAISHTYKIGIFNEIGLGLAYLVVAGMAAFGLTGKLNVFWSVIVILPQQMLLMFSAWGAGAAIIAGQFADGVPRPHEFIAADQGPVILLALGHSAALLDHILVDLLKHGLKRRIGD